MGEASYSPEIIFIDGIEYRREDPASSIRIVILQRGWVYVGRLRQESKSECVLTDAACIRIWGTTKGLPELCEGPTPKTVLDKTAYPVRFHPLTMIASLDVKESAWAPVL